MKTSELQLSRNYDRAAWFYEASSNLYSTAELTNSRRSTTKLKSFGNRRWQSEQRGSDFTTANIKGDEVEEVAIGHFGQQAFALVALP